MSSLNQQVVARLLLDPASKTPLFDTLDLRGQMESHDAECWFMYLREGEALPAGGRHWSLHQWRQGRADGSPQEVADLLDNPE